MTYSSDVAFTPTVKSVQARNGSRRAYARMEEAGAWETPITAWAFAAVAPGSPLLAYC